MSEASQLDVAAIARAHPDVFPGPGRALRRWGPWALALAYLLWSLWYFDFAALFDSSDRALVLLRAVVDWQDMGEWQYATIYRGIAETVAMAFLGTLLATVLCLVVGFMSARNVVPMALPRHAVRRVLDVLRGVDQLIWGLVFVRAVGLGPLAGVLAIFVNDVGTLGKLYSEAIENIDRQQVEGVRATGAGPLKVIRYGYLPQVAPIFLSQSLYFFESATRTATILGIVGAGGIGMIIIERFRASLYDQVAFVVLNVLIVIAVIDWVSGKLRRRLIGRVE
ncbi:phosphonate ABC transporter, permease protein PhnE [Roseovarius tibetensis]|uniref:phosphonate ABC transporter, permease protein PhnE n=1 Tax=Roseovarius tibetensis TaxID=2685897 RepID=UPI003D7FB8D9